MYRATLSASALVLGATAVFATPMDFDDPTLDPVGTTLSLQTIAPALNDGRGGNTPPTYNGPTFDGALFLQAMPDLGTQEGMNAFMDVAPMLIQGEGRNTSAEQYIAHLTFSGTSQGGGASVQAFNGSDQDNGQINADPISAVPLPAGLPLLMAGLFGLGVLRRSRKGS